MPPTLSLFFVAHHFRLSRVVLAPFALSLFLSLARSALRPFVSRYAGAFSPPSLILAFGEIFSRAEKEEKRRDTKMQTILATEKSWKADGSIFPPLRVCLRVSVTGSEVARYSGR